MIFSYLIGIDDLCKVKEPFSSQGVLPESHNYIKAGAGSKFTTSAYFTQTDNYFKSMMLLAKTEIIEACKKNISCWLKYKCTK